jgi:glutamate/tyrosine decarboxylase-like PLP-dependent enzyme
VLFLLINTIQKECMFQKLKKDIDQIDELLTAVKNISVNYLSQINLQPTSRQKPLPENSILSVDGLGLENTLNYFQQHHANKIVASSGPRYWGFVTGGTTPAAIAGDWLTAVYDQNTQGVTGGGDVSAAIEFETIDLLLQLFQLAATFNGGFVTGATMANFTGLAVGRQWAGLQNNNDIAWEGVKTDIKILTSTPHSSAVKSLSLLGLGSSNIITVRTMEGNREAMDMEDFESKLKQQQSHPVIVISSGGTVNTVDFDDMAAMAALKKKYAFFWHIDAAFGGFAACSKEYQHLVKGWEEADSIAIDCHKWMNVPYDSAVCFVQKKHAAIQVQTFQNSNAPYLGNPEENFSYLNYGPENSRRFRALPAWFSLMAYGEKGFAWMVENSIAMARLFAERLEAETDFILTAPVRLNVVCFTIKEEAGRNERVKQVLAKLNENAKVFLTPTFYKGIYCLRAAFVNWRTTEADIDIAIRELK